MKLSWVRFNFLLGVICISFSPLVVKVAVFTSTTGAFYRSLYAAVFLLIWSAILYKKEFASKDSRWVLPCVIGGAALGIDLIFWHKTIFYLGAGPATFLGNSQIIFVTIFAVLVFKECLSKRFLIFVCLTLTGLYLLMPDVVNTVNRTTGYFFGIIVGLTYAIMLISMRYAKSRSGSDYPEILSLAVIFVVSSVVIAIDAVFIERTSLLVFDPRSHLLMMLTSFFAQTLGWYLIKSNLTKISAHEASLLLVLQPVLSTIWGRIFFSEPLSWVQLVGIAMASGGIVFYLWKSSPNTVETCILGEAK